MFLRLLPPPRNTIWGLWDLEERENCESEETRSSGYLVRSLGKGRDFYGTLDNDKFYADTLGGLLGEWLYFYGRKIREGRVHFVRMWRVICVYIWVRHLSMKFWKFYTCWADCERLHFRLCYSFVIFFIGAFKYLITLVFTCWLHVSFSKQPSFNRLALSGHKTNKCSRVKRLGYANNG